ncbi:hypothetical protein [Calothrix rhizosoleniae]|uniref:hypothetical protein n=1 Tax=Calothrix rhizosoleniae TaxID=888997 RepID=UPI000B49C8ED|nr:hypothetical protein [Calothrix rhizosoleniae]
MKVGFGSLIVVALPNLSHTNLKNDCDRWKARKAYTVALSQSRTVAHEGNQRQSSATGNPTTTLAPQDHTVLKI